MSLVELLLFTPGKSDSQRAHDKANDDLAMAYNPEEENDAVLHARNDHTFRKWTVGSVRSLKDGQGDLRRAMGRMGLLMLAIIALELMHKDGAGGMLLSVLKALVTP